MTRSAVGGAGLSGDGMNPIRCVAAMVSCALAPLLWTRPAEASALTPLVAEGPDELRLTYQFAPPSFDVWPDGLDPQVQGCRTLAAAPGQPRIPVAYTTVVLPPGRAVAGVEWTGAAAQLSGAVPLTWGPEAQRVGLPALPRNAPDSAIYGSDALYPAQLVNVTGEGWFRGYHLATLAVRPMQFRPASKRVWAWSRIEVRLRLIPAPDRAVAPPRQLPVDLEELARLAANPETGYSYGAPAANDESADAQYLVITPQRLASAFDRLVQHRAASGVPSALLYVEDVLAGQPGRDDAEKVRNAIAQYYREHGTRFVLLGGDDMDDALQPLMPVRFCPEYDNNPSDYYFGALDGDWDTDGDGTFCEVNEIDYYSEVHVGRATVDTVEEANRWIDKVLLYESGLPEDRRRDLLWIGEKLDNSTWGEDNKSYVAQVVPSEYVLDKLNARDETFSAAAVIASLNRGPNLTNHAGHANAFYVMGINVSDVEALINPTPFFSYCGIACDPGAFDQGFSGSGEAIGEHFLTAPHGAAAVVMNGRAGWYYTPGVSTGLSTDLDRAFYDALFNRGCGRFGEANDQARADNAGVAQTEWMMRYCFVGTNLLGDPATPAQIRSNQVLYGSHRVIEADPFYGDADGVADPGETIEIAVTLTNSGAEAAHGVEAFLTSSAAGVTVHDGYAAWPDIPPGASAENLPHHFTATLNLACGAEAAFRLEVRHDGRVDVSVFTLPVGQVSEITVLEDDFETDRGWTAGSSAQQGAFVREDPNGVTDSTVGPVQAGDDATPGAGVTCWVTGNPPVGPGFNPRTGDVKKGTVYVHSPAFNGTGDGRLRLRFSRWFHRTSVTQLNAGDYIAKVSTDGGSTWTDLERLDSNASAWRVREFDLTSVSPPTSNMKVRFEATDYVLMAPPEPLVELMIDDVRVYRRVATCSSFSPGETRPPNAVGPTLVVQKGGPDLALRWTAPPSDANHDRARSFPVHRSSSCQGDFAVLGAPTEAAWTDGGAAAAAYGTLYFVVSAENAAGGSGEAPTP